MVDCVCSLIGFEKKRVFAFFHRRDHIREEQSLRICQGHPNIVQLQEVFQDDVSIVMSFTTEKPEPLLFLGLCFTHKG